MKQRIIRALRRAQYAAMGAAVGGFLGGILSRNAASTGAATGALVGAILGEKRHSFDTVLEEVRSRDTEQESESSGRMSRLRKSAPKMGD